MKHLLLVFSLLISSLTIQAQYTLESGDITLNSSGYISECNKTFASDEKDIIIPESIDGVTIKGIIDLGCDGGGGCFYELGLTSVQLPTSLEYIGKNAFRSNSLTGKLDFSNCANLTYIGKTAFYDNLLTEADFNNCSKLTTIHEYAFGKNDIEGELDLSTCTSLQLIKTCSFSNNKLTKVIINSPALTQIESFAFKSNQLTEVDLSECSSLTTINKYTFSTNNITTVDLSNCSSLTQIGMYAFSTNQITSLNLANCTQLTTISDYAFYNNKLTTIDLTSQTNLTSIEKCAFYSNEITDVNLSGLSNLSLIGYSSFSNNSITNVDLSNCSSLPEIGELAFSTNQITSLNLNNCSSLTTIGESAFAQNELTEVDLSLNTNLTHIGESAFDDNNISVDQNLYDCTNLKYIGANAFANNSSISGIILPNTTEWITDQSQTYSAGTTTTDYLSAYYNYYTLTDEDVVVTDGEIISCSYSFASSAIVIPEMLDEQQVISIADSDTLSGLFKQKDIYFIKLPASIETIGSYAFYNCALQAIDISECSSLDSIKLRAFQYGSIETVDFSNCTSLNYIGAYAFGNNNISSVVGLENCLGLTYIDTYGFYNNSELSSILLPNITYSNNHKCFWTADNTYIELNTDGNYEVNDFDHTFKSAHTVIFNNYDGTFVAQDTVIYGATASSAITPSQDEYTFIGWDPDVDNITDTLTTTAQYVRTDADKYIFKLSTHSGTPLTYAKITIGDDYTKTNNNGVTTFPLITDGCTYSIYKSSLYADITGSIAASETGTTIIIDTLSTVTFSNPENDFSFSDGQLEMNGKTFSLSNNQEYELFIADGTYNYVFTHDNSHAPSLSGTINIDGNDISESLNFYTTTFTVKTDQDSLINDATINIEELELSTTTNSNGVATLYLPSGTYNYTATHALLADEITGTFTITDANISEEVMVYSAEFLVKADYQTTFKNAHIKIGTASAYTNDDGEATIYLPEGDYSYKVTHSTFAVDSISNTLSISDASVFENITLFTATFNITAHNNGIENTNIEIGNKTLATNTEGTAYTYVPDGTYEATISNEAFTQDSTISLTMQGTMETLNLELIKANFNVSLTDDTPIQNAVIQIDESTHNTNGTGTSAIYFYTGDYTYSINHDNIGGTINSTISAENDSIAENNTVYTATFNLTMADGTYIENEDITIDGVISTTNSQGSASIQLFPGTYEYSIQGLNKHDNVTISSSNITIDITGLYEATFLTTIAEYMNFDLIDIIIDNDTVTSSGGKACFYLSPGTYNYTANSSSCVGEVSGSIDISDSNISEKVTLLMLRLSVNDDETPINNANIVFNEYPDLHFTTGTDGNKDVMGVFDGEYAYTVSDSAYTGSITDTLKLAAFDSENIIYLNTEEIKVLITDFTTNYCSIIMNDTEYIGSNTFMLPDSSTNYEIGVGDYNPISGSFNRLNTSVTQNNYFIDTYVVDSETEEPINNATLTFRGNDYSPEEENYYPLLIFDNGFENIYDFSAAGYKDTTITLVTDSVDYITIKLTPETDPITYTVTFVDWDETQLDQQTIEDGNAATEPTTPTRTGYIFTGWDIEFNMVTSDLTVTAQYSFPTAVNENETEKIFIYPNPVQDLLNLNMENLPSGNSLTISITNMAGKIVYQASSINTKETIDVSMLNNGVYFIQVANYNVSKFVKE